MTPVTPARMRAQRTRLLQGSFAASILRALEQLPVSERLWVLGFGAEQVSTALCGLEVCADGEPEYAPEADEVFLAGVQLGEVGDQMTESMLRQKDDEVHHG